MKTDDLIVQLADSLAPVRPLASPMRRLTMWVIGTIAVTAVCVLIIGPRRDSSVVEQQYSFLLLAIVTLATGVLSAGAALVLSVPAAERTPAQHWTPIVVAGIWAAVLVEAIVSGGATLSRIVAMPVHSLCIIEIIGLAIVPGWLLFKMLRTAAPIRLSWSAGLASLAALALGALGTQFLCPINDPAHLLVGHTAPVGVFAAVGASIGGAWVRRGRLNIRRR